MKEETIISLLNQATYEIRELRRKNEILSAKVGVMEDFMLVLRTPPVYGSVGLSEDVARALEQQIASLKADIAARPTASPQAA